MSLRDYGLALGELKRAGSVGSVSVARLGYKTSPLYLPTDLFSTSTIFHRDVWTSKGNLQSLSWSLETLHVNTAVCVYWMERIFYVVNATCGANFVAHRYLESERFQNMTIWTKTTDIAQVNMSYVYS